MTRVEVIGNAVLYNADCRDILPTLGKVDAVIADPPYGTTRCSWDTVVPFDEMWAAVNSVAGKNCPVLMFGSEPFSSHLRLSNLHRFKYDWVWDKPKGTGFLNAKKKPMRCHEIVSVFCDGMEPYYPQKTLGHERKQAFRSKELQTEVYGEMAGDYFYDSTERYPRSVQTFSSDTQNSSLHPTQKPVAFLEYLCRTYTLPNTLILDPFMGSGTTGIAACNQGRRFIGIEKDTTYFEIAVERFRSDLLIAGAA